VDYIDRRPVAALVYKRREHVINLFVLAIQLTAGGARGRQRIQSRGLE